MKYALGNMLNGAGGLNADQLALDLQFAADKTLTARRGPTPVFTRASSGTFVGSDGLIQSAGNNIARFDHDPANPSVCRGLLIEESRTNLLQRSEEFDVTTYWDVVRSAIGTNATTSPDGLVTAEKLIADTTAANNHRVDRAPANLALNTVHTVSVFAKAAEYTGLALGVGLGAVEGVRYSLVGAGTATPVAAGFTGTIQQLGNGWYRCAATFTSDAVTTGHRVAIYVGQNGTTFTYTGDNTSGIFIWGAQLEAGFFATSYIPTTTASVVRSADVCSITGAAFSGFYNNTEGTLFANAASLGVGVAQNPVVSIENGASQILRLRHLATTNRLGVIVSGVSLTSSSGFDSVRVFYKSAVSAGPTGADFVINGTQISDTFTGSLLTADNMKIAVSTAGLSNTIISSIRYYKKQLSVAKLQALTV